MPVRHDIQFLRGFAVLAVLLYHANIFSISGGFLGVDVFFVISGYLITSIILRDLDERRFSFAAFYLRRAKRLLPAAYSTLIFTTLLGYAFLTTGQWNDYVEQLVGTITFTANLVLPFQTGYFENAAESKPLLHIWSLSLEEQYYLVTPLLLFLIKPKWRGTVFIIAFVVSLVVCVMFVTFPFTYWRLPSINSENMAFFLLLTRAWELLAGSILAHLVRRLPRFNISRLIKLSVLFMTTIIVLFPIDSIHPRGDAFLVVIATAVMLAGTSEWLPQNKVTNSVAKVGDWSYSLYLVHWPLFAFAHNAYLGETPTHIKLLLLLASMLLAYWQYEFVEQRFRYGWKANQKRTFQWLASASLMVILTPAPALFSQHVASAAGTRDFSYLQIRNVGLNVHCTNGQAIVNAEPCMTSKKPKFAIWGDSYAMHLVPGLVISPQIRDSLIQITKSACAPILGVASIDSNYDEFWAKNCLEFNEQVVQLLRDSESIEYVIMSSPFDGYFGFGELSLFYQGQKTTGERSIAINQMVTTIETIREYGKYPVLVTPPPKAGFNIGECWERKETGLIVLGRSDCNFTVNEYHSYQRDIIDAINEVQNRTNVDVIWLDEIICDEEQCRTAINETSIYRDDGHLSVPGSQWVIPRLELASRLLRNTLQ